MKTVIFDFGNVIGLFDHIKALSKLKDHSPFSPQEMVRSAYAGTLESDVETGRITPDDFLREVHAKWKLTCSIDFLRGVVRDIFEPNPETIDLITCLASRYRLVLGSNTNSLHAEQFLDQFADVLSQFHHLGLSHLIGHRKPSAEFFQHLQQHAEAKPNECVFIDDMPENIEAARQHGWHGVVYRRDGSLEKELRALGVEV